MPRPRRVGGARVREAGLAMILGVAAGGCDLGGPDETPDTAPLRVLGIEVTAADADGNLVPTQVAVDGSTRPVPTTSLRVKVDRYLDPASANRQALCLQSDTAIIVALEDCARGLLLRPSYDPLERTVTFYLADELTRLAPDTLYRVTLFEADGAAGDFGLRAIDGTPLEGIFALEFTTAADDPSRPTEGPPTDPGFCGTGGVREILLGNCAFGGCHAAIPGQGGSPDLFPPMGLDLSGPDAIARTAVAQVAHHSQRGPSATSPDEASTSFGRSMAIVAPANPGQSFLLYKMLLDPSFAGDPTLAAGETELLRRIIPGAPMPIKPGAITLEQARKVSDWIESGAAIPACP